MAIQDVLQRWKSLCTPFRLPPPWDCTVPDASHWLAPDFPGTALARLAEEFTEVALCEGGLAQQMDDGLAVRTSLLTTPGACLLDSDFHQSVASADAFAPTFGLPSFWERLESDIDFTMFRRTSGVLILTGGRQDAAIQRSFGLPAISVDTFAPFGFNDELPLARCFGVSRTLSHREQEEKQAFEFDENAEVAAELASLTAPVAESAAEPAVEGDEEDEVLRSKRLQREAFFAQHEQERRMREQLARNRESRFTEQFPAAARILERLEELDIAEPVGHSFPL